MAPEILSRPERRLSTPRPGKEKGIVLLFFSQEKTARNWLFFVSRKFNFLERSGKSAANVCTCSPPQHVPQLKSFCDPAAGRAIEVVVIE